MRRKVEESYLCRQSIVFFALFQDDPSIQIVEQTRSLVLEKYRSCTSYEGMPILVAVRHLKAGRAEASRLN